MTKKSQTTATAVAVIIVVGDADDDKRKSGIFVSKVGTSLRMRFGGCMECPSHIEHAKGRLDP